MIEKKDTISNIGAKVFLVAYDEPTLLDAKLLFELEKPFPILLDRKKETYQTWGMGRTTNSKSFLSPVLTYRYLKLLLKGERFLGFAPDMLQLGGDFIINKNSNISFAYRMKVNDDRASVEKLLSELEKVS